MIINNENKLICSSYTGKNGNLSWVEGLSQRENKFSDISSCSLFVTINTLDSNDRFDISKIIDSFPINKIYIGLPDPSLTSYFPNDPFFQQKNLYRYPEDLQKVILNDNLSFYDKSMQNIQAVPLYYKNSISKSVINELEANGLTISAKELRENNTNELLATLISQKYNLDYSSCFKKINGIVSSVFNQKYGSYSYSNDSRLLDNSWITIFKELILKQTQDKNFLTEANIVNVGVGGGNEAQLLFSNGSNITFIDIAQDGLKKVKKKFPAAKTVMSSATDLHFLPNQSQDLYVSLRTFNSSFFDMKRATREAFRILKDKSPIIISIANGFLNKIPPRIISGLILPGTKFVDIYRGFDTCNFLSSFFKRIGFKDVQIVPTNTEIFLSAVKSSQDLKE
ncbi:methyltransferase domain-containing protein [Lactobacillus helsingborgensis]|uniref:methyltransferase domain-containing protein n=1 Tax=Lactobacillus helsingborgensis TaxID=1218494 RepID=UPI00164F4419|nr:methyltransferase domain-containing protein [Lactobacillus helsingborgensis]MBC6356724.1 methyltransferase domain-containing protein [Lactobacillus helsingborgensis]